jgi:hypothetical protein
MPNRTQTNSRKKLSGIIGTAEFSDKETGATQPALAMED